MKLLRAGAVFLGIAFSLLACAQRVEPDAGTVLDAGKPDLMFLIDKSGSMAFPTDTSNAACPAGCGPDGAGGSTCPASCPTRISQLRTAMDTFLSGPNLTLARMGLTIFPTGTPGGGGTIDACGATTNGDLRVQLSQSLDVDAELSATATQVKLQIDSLKIGGGTPTADSLRFLGNYLPLNDPVRDDFVLLLTDGAPNCNSNNLIDCNNAAACRCTTSACTTTNGLCKAGCLDQDNTVIAVYELRKKNIRTIVLGFGAEAATGNTADVLDALANAGGVPRSCPNGTDAECGTNNPCDMPTRLCTRKFYQAANAAELTAALGDIARLLSAQR